MTVTEELEIKLYQLLKNDNWSDENAQAAVGVVKGMQKDANKDLATKVDLSDTHAALKVDLANLKTDMVTRMYVASSVATVVQILGTLGGLFGILKFMQVL
ncbi:MAG: hypothetical protein WA958_16125 [Tunicatimonas sp.]